MNRDDVWALVKGLRFEAISDALRFLSAFTGLLSNQGEKSINFHFIMVPLKKKY